MKHRLFIDIPPDKYITVVATTNQPILTPINGVSLLSMPCQQLYRVVQPELVNVDNS
jgi:hypothetical protein